MLPHRWTFVLLAAGCLAAAAGGGYLAVRDGVTRAAVPSVAATSGPANAAGTPSTGSTPPAPAQVPVPPPAAAEPPAQPLGRPPVEERALRVPERAPARRDVRAAPERGRVVMAPEPLPRAAAPKPVYGPVADARPVTADQWALLERTLPSGNPGAPPPPPAPAPADLAPIEQYVISADSVIGLEIDTPLSSETAQVEDPVEAHVTRDVKVGDKIAIPAGTRVRGTVVEVEQGGKFRARARLGIEFNTILMADGSELSIRTNTIYRDGPSPGEASSAKISASTVAGTILGAIFGGARGALIGGATGAAGGTAMVEAGGRQPATFPPGTPVTVQLRAPVIVTSEK